MIEPTDEMLTAFREAVRQGGDSTDEIRAAGIAAVLAIVERDYAIQPKPKPMFIGPSDHAFQPHDDPNFGSVFGGGCGAEVDGMLCGWPRSAHRATS